MRMDPSRWKKVFFAIVTFLFCSNLNAQTLDNFFSPKVLIPGDFRTEGSYFSDSYTTIILHARYGLGKNLELQLTHSNGDLSSLGLRRGSERTAVGLKAYLLGEQKIVPAIGINGGLNVTPNRDFKAFQPYFNLLLQKSISRKIKLDGRFGYQSFGNFDDWEFTYQFNTRLYATKNIAVRAGILDQSPFEIGHRETSTVHVNIGIEIWLLKWLHLAPFIQFDTENTARNYLGFQTQLNF